MKLERWTLFIDMLGYGAMNGRVKTDEEADEFIKFMQTNVELIASQDNEKMRYGYSKTNFDLYEYYDMKTVFVSDSVIIAYTPKEVEKLTNENHRILHSANALFIILQRLQILIYNCMNEKKIMVRGGISNKFSKIDGNFAVGEGIIEAYTLESKTAIYPRIVLSDSIMGNESLIKGVKFLSQKIYNINSIIETDERGISYLDYMGYNIRHALQGGFNLLNLAVYQAFFLEHKATIEYHYKATKIDIEEVKSHDKPNEKLLNTLNGILEKYTWLRDYHNRKIKMLSNQKLEEHFQIPKTTDPS